MTEFLFWCAMLSTVTMLATATWYFWAMGGDHYQDCAGQFALASIAAVISYFCLFFYTVLSYAGV